MAVEEINTPDGKKLVDSKTRKLMGSRGDGMDHIPTISETVPLADTLDGHGSPKTSALEAYEKFVKKMEMGTLDPVRTWTPEDMAKILRDESTKPELTLAEIENLKQEHRGYAPFECPDEKCSGDDNRRPHAWCIKCGTTIPCAPLREAGLMEDIDGAIREVCIECNGTGALMLHDYEGELVKRPCKNCGTSGLTYQRKPTQKPAPTHLYDKLLAFRPVVGVKTLDTIKERFAESVNTDEAIEAGWALGRAEGIDEGIGEAIGLLPPVLVENSPPVAQAEFSRIKNKAEAFDAMYEDAGNVRHLINLYYNNMADLTSGENGQLEKISSSLPQEIRDLKAIATGLVEFWYAHAAGNCDQRDPSGRSRFDTGNLKKEDN